MRVTVDAIPDFVFEYEPENLAQAVAFVAASLEQRGLALQAVLVDGEDLSPAGLVERLEGIAPAAETTLEVQSAPVDALILDALDELAEVLPELATACHGIAESVSHEPWDAVQEQFQQLAQIWSAVKERQRQVLEFMGCSPESVDVQGQTLADRDVLLAGALQKAGSLSEGNDRAGFVDVLSYELAAAAELEVVAVLSLQKTHKRAG